MEIAECVLDYQKHNLSQDGITPKSTIFKISYISSRRIKKRSFNYCIISLQLNYGRDNTTAILKLNFDAMFDIGFSMFKEDLAKIEKEEIQQTITYNQKCNIGKIFTKQDFEWIKANKYASKDDLLNIFFKIKISNRALHSVKSLFTKRNKQDLSLEFAECCKKFLKTKVVESMEYISFDPKYFVERPAVKPEVERPDIPQTLEMPIGEPVENKESAETTPLIHTKLESITSKISKSFDSESLNFTLMKMFLIQKVVDIKIEDFEKFLDMLRKHNT